MSVLPGLMDMHVHVMIPGHADYWNWNLSERAHVQGSHAVRSLIL